MSKVRLFHFLKPTLLVFLLAVLVFTSQAHNISLFQKAKIDTLNNTLTSNPNIAITFRNATTSKYGFDAKTKEELADKYEKVADQTTNADLYIGWKAVEAEKVETIDVQVTSSSAAFKADSVKFVRDNEAKIPSTPSLAANTKQLTVYGNSDGIEGAVYAVYPNTSGGQNLAKLNLISYEKVTKKLYLIPLNGANVNAQEIKTALNSIYSQAVASFDVEAKPSFTPPKSTIDVGNSGLLSTYTADMQAIIDAYQAANSDVDEEDYYVFIGGTPSDAGQKGYMPRAKHFGFIFSNDTKTISHELGHGVFHLKHTFAETSVAQGSSDNLMDYSTGTYLNKYQWDAVHDPELVVGLFESDKAGALGGMVWLTPDWRPFSVANTNVIAHSTIKVPPGTVPAIKKDGKSYLPEFDKDNKFLGYFYNHTESLLGLTFASYNEDSKSRINLFQNNGGCGMDKYYETSYAYAISNKDAINFDNASDLKFKGIIECGSVVISKINSTNDDAIAKDLINKQLISLAKNSLTRNGFKLKKVFYVTYLSDADNQDFINEFKNYDTGKDNIVFWITFDKKNNAIALKNFRNPSIVSVENNQLIARIADDLNKEPTSWQFIMVYELSDLLSQGLDKLIFPSVVYNCNDPKYNKLYPKIFSALNSTNIVQNIITTGVLEDNYSVFKKIDEETEQLKFAFYCGVWNGLVGVVKSVPDLAHFASSPFSPTGRDQLTKRYTKFIESEITDQNGTIICKSDDFACKGREMVKSGVKAAFENNCVSAHTMGSIAGPLVLAFFGDPAAITGELGTLSATIKSTLQFFKWCDNAGEIFTYLGKFGKAGFKLVKNSSGDLLANFNVGNTNLIRQQDENFIVKQLKNGEVVEVTMTKDELKNITQAELEKVLVKVNGAGNWMDDIFNLQKSVVNQNKNIISNASNNEKGSPLVLASAKT